MPIYMKYEISGSPIEGDVTATGYEKQIELDSFQWGIGRGVSSAMGSSGNRQSSAPSISEITITKQQDQGTVKILEESLNGTGATVTISFVRTGSPPILFLKYTLNNVILSGYSISSGGDRPTESLSLNFAKIEINVIPEGADTTEGSNIPVVYDLALMKLNP